MKNKEEEKGYTYHTEGNIGAEIPSKKIVLRILGKIIAICNISDANEVAGKDLTNSEVRRRVATLVTKNGKLAQEKERLKEEKRQEKERQKEAKRQEKERQKEAKRQERKAEKEAKEEVKESKKEAKREGVEGGKKKFKAKYLIPILIPLAIMAIGIRSCAKSMDENNKKDNSIDDKEKPGETDREENPNTGETKNEEPIEETELRTITITRTETVPIDLTVYNIDNPSVYLEGLVNSSGQEGLTANLNSRSSFEGGYYSSHIQFGEEAKAVEGVDEFQLRKAAIDAHMETLENPDATAEEKAKAIQGILEIEQGIRDSYAARKGMASQHAEAFATSSEAFRDSHTDEEEMAVNLMVESYMFQLGLSSENVAQLEILQRLIEDGYQPTITSVRQEKDGDYRITGSMLKEITEEIVIGEAAQTWKGFASYTRGESTRSTAYAERIGKDIIKGEDGTNQYAVEETGKEK